MQDEARPVGHRPWMDVEVETDVGSPPYQAWAELLYGDDEAKWWLDLGDLLAGRPGWHVDLDRTGGRLGLLWSFGAFGSSLFNVTAVGPSQFDLFDYDGDTNHLITGVDDLRGWLEENESRHADPFAKVRTWVSADDWYAFRIFPYDVQVTVDGDGRWQATVAGLPGEAAFAADLGGVLTAVREMLCTAAAAPPEVAAALRLQVRLDEDAAAALTRGGGAKE